MSSHEHLIHENDSAIETFDSDTDLDVSAKNLLIQHIENPKTMKKTSDSIYIYELFALSVFDFSIDIDFEIYTIDIETVIQFSVTKSKQKMQLSSFHDFALRNISFNWSRFCTSSINRRIFSISIFTIIVSNVTFDFIEIVKIVDIENIEFCEREQSFCFIDNFVSILNEISNIDFYEKKQFFCFVDFSVSISVDVISMSEHNDFYEKKQFCFFVDTVDIVDITIIIDVIVNIDAFTLTADMIKKKKI